MAAAAAAQLQAALLNHDRTKRSTEIPLFYGKKEMDTINPQFLLDRITHAAAIAGWNPDRQREEFYMILRDKALVWYEALGRVPGIDRNDWAVLQREFLAAFAPKFTAKTNCSNFSEMIQRPQENVQDYYLRIFDTFRNMCQAKPAAMAVVRADGAAPRAEVKQEGIADMEMFFLHQLFLAGLKEDIRSKTMEGNRPQLHESLALARETEIILADRKGSKGNTVASIEETKEKPQGQVTDDDNKWPDGLDDEEVEIINAIRFKRGNKQPFKRNPNSGNYQNKGSGGQGGQAQNFQRGPFKCFYCKKPNHYQRDCKTRLRDGAPMVNAKGEPYKPRVATIQENQNEPGADMYKLSTIGMNSLNW